MSATPKSTPDPRLCTKRFVILTPMQTAIVQDVADDEGVELQAFPYALDNGYAICDEDLGLLSDLRPGLISILREHGRLAI